MANKLTLGFAAIAEWEDRINSINEQSITELELMDEQVSSESEYYYRRGNKFYFRGSFGKLMFYTDEPEKLKELIKGRKYQLNFGS